MGKLPVELADEAHELAFVEEVLGEDRVLHDLFVAHDDL